MVRESGVHKIMNKETKQDWSLFSREELERRVQQLQEQNDQLKKKLLIEENEENEEKETKSKKKKKEKPFNFSKYPHRHILLKFLYLGWNRQGYAMQDDTDNTIETALIKALLTTKLIESKSNANYNRCGRTDRGVSAFSQVVSITVRSAVSNVNTKNDGLKTQENLAETVKNEMNYPKILNRVLPQDIRILGWCPVPPKFSARFDCNRRTYKYFFPRSNLNLEAMNKAAQYLIGRHDYRNFCKMNVAGGVVKFTRRICNFTIEELDYVPRPKQDLCETEETPSPGSCNDNSSQESQDEALLEDNEDEISLQDYQNEGQFPLEAQDKAPRSQSPQGKSPPLESQNEDPSPSPQDKSIPLESLNEALSQAPQVENLSQNSRQETPLQDSQNENPSLLSEGAGCGTLEPSWIRSYRMCVATIEGTAFLWHQIRAIMTVLILVGQGKEDPMVVKQLLDVDTIKRRPQYGFASGIGLSLYDTQYKNLDWQYDKDNLSIVIFQLQITWAEFAIKSSMIQSMLSDLSAVANENFPSIVLPAEQVTSCLQESRPCLKEENRKVYTPLLERLTGESLEDRVRHYVEKKKLDPSYLKPFEKESENKS